MIAQSNITETNIINDMRTLGISRKELSQISYNYKLGITLNNINRALATERIRKQIRKILTLFEADQVKKNLE